MWRNLSTTICFDRQLNQLIYNNAIYLLKVLIPARGHLEVLEERERIMFARLMDHLTSSTADMKEPGFSSRRPNLPSNICTFHS